MPDPAQYDLAFRPASYWEAPDPLTAILLNIKGTRRREMIRDIVTGHAGVMVTELVERGSVTQPQADVLREVFAEVEPRLLETALAEPDRVALGRIHPAFMGGEYLPDYLPGEVEIARVELASVTADVTSYRARRRGKRILYRVVDEYATPFAFPRSSSIRPLTLGQLIALIDGTSYADEDPKWFVHGFTNGLREGAESPDFVRVWSDFYPRVVDWYADEALECVTRVASRQSARETSTRTSASPACDTVGRGVELWVRGVQLARGSRPRGHSQGQVDGVPGASGIPRMGRRGAFRPLEGPFPPLEGPHMTTDPLLAYTPDELPGVDLVKRTLHADDTVECCGGRYDGTRLKKDDALVVLKVDPHADQRPVLPLGPTRHRSPMKLLTSREKKAIRNGPCGRCGAVPPFQDGTLCHPHRIIPGSEGGKYTRRNTVPRCMQCHDLEHGGNGTAPFIGAARAGGRRTHELHPEHARAIGLKYGHKGGSKGGLRTHKLYPELASENGRKYGRRGGVKGKHMRWHVLRGQRNENCALCTAGPDTTTTGTEET